MNVKQTHDFSVVTTLFQSSSTIESFQRELNRTMEIMKASDPNIASTELVIVDDGSGDESAKIASELAWNFDSITLIELSKNFGHHQALRCGLEHCNGEFVALIDSDMEEQPSYINPMFSKLLLNPQIACCYGVQKTRKGNFFERILGSLFYSISDILAPGAFQRDVCTIRVMSRKFVDSILLHNERRFVIGGIWNSIGFATESFLINKGAKGTSTYNLKKKVKLAIDCIVNFSSRPLTILSTILLFTSCITTLGSIALAIFGILAGAIPGWVSIILFLSLNSLILSLLGIAMSLYISAIFDEVKQRPSTITKKVSNL